MTSEAAVKRFDPEVTFTGDCDYVTRMEEGSNGDYVRYEDYAHLVARNAALVAALRLAYESMAGNNSPFDPEVWARAVDAASAALQSTEAEAGKEGV